MPSFNEWSFWASFISKVQEKCDDINPLNTKKKAW